SCHSEQSFATGACACRPAAANDAATRESVYRAIRAQRTLKFTPLRSALRPLRQRKRRQRTSSRHQQVLATIEHVCRACCRSQWESKLVMPEVFSASRIERHEV